MRFLLLLLAIPLAAQTVRFTPTGERIGAYLEYAVSVCAPETANAIITPNLLQAHASLQSIDMATNVGLLASAGNANKMSWQRRAAVGAEVGAGIGALAIASGKLKIAEDGYRVVIVAAGPAIRIITTAYPAQDPNPQVDAFPSRIDAPAGQCVGAKMYGVPR